MLEEQLRVITRKVLKGLVCDPSRAGSTFPLQLVNGGTQLCQGEMKRQEIFIPGAPVAMVRSWRLPVKERSAGWVL